MPYIVGTDILSFCTFCKKDRIHTVIGVSERGVVERVRCNICGQEHSYKKPRDEGESGKREKLQQKKEQKAKSLWEEYIKNRDLSEAREYDIKDSYMVGEIINHSSFGIGIVLRLIEKTKMEVIFEDGIKILAHNKDK